jgi:hypothetical protein
MDSVLLFLSAAEMHFLISNPMAAPIGGGTALPIYNRTVTFMKRCYQLIKLKNH